MRSTTAEISIEAGLHVLNALVHGRSPRCRAEEQSALAALGALHRGEDLTRDEIDLRKALHAALETLQAPEVERLLDRIRNRSGFKLRRFRRHVLLFVLLAKTTASISRFVILPVLHRRGLFGSPERVDVLLGCLPRLSLLPSTRRMGLAYLEAAATVLFAGDELRLSSPKELGPDGFQRLPWPRQIVHLLAWRTAWDAYAADNAAVRAADPSRLGGTVEYRLAREGCFAGVVSRGGGVARAALRRLGYVDHRTPRRVRMRRAALLIVGLVALTASAAFCLARLGRWDRVNEALAAQMTNQRAPMLATGE